MSLLVWLPLQGDLRNNGLAGDITVTNSGATVNSAGKIGKCYEFPKTADGKLTYPRVMSGNVAEFSVAGWINLNSGYGTNNGFHLINWGLSYGRICFSKDGYAVRVLMTDGDSGATAGYASVMTASQVSAGIWYHVAVCFDNGDLRIYINGELDNQVTTTISTVKVTAASVIIGLFGSEYGSGKLNDYRFYDHALSDREVKELSKGLVAHWKLDEEIDGADLLPEYSGWEYDIIHDASGYCHDGIMSETPPVYVSDSVRYQKCLQFTAADHMYIDCGLDNWLPTDYLTVTWWGYMTNWGSYGRAISCTETGGWNFEPGSGKIRFCVYKNGIGYNHSISETDLSSLSSGWHHFAGTFDGYVSKLYIDGELEAVSEDASPDVKALLKYNARAKLFIGCEPNAAEPHAPYFNGKLSDVRIYGTALSIEDIRELYSVSASIDNRHNVYTREFVEG